MLLSELILCFSVLKRFSVKYYCLLVNIILDYILGQWDPEPDIETVEIFEIVRRYIKIKMYSGSIPGTIWTNSENREKKGSRDFNDSLLDSKFSKACPIGISIFP